MKKITTLLTTLLLSGIIMAQVPTGSFFEFKFTNGSLNNTSSSGAPNFSGSITSIADRNGSGGDAADITGVLNGASVGAANVNEMTLAFWMKHDPITPVSNERILQIYGAWGNGFRLQMDGNQLMYNGKAGNGGGSPSSIESELVNIDDAAWHHIAIRTTLSATSDTLEFDVFLDNVLQPNLSNNTINVLGPMTTFLTNANLVVSPTGNYSGDIDDIYFYKSALTDAEITQIYFNNCLVNIPDANFKAYLVGNTAINTNGNSQIECSEAAAFTGNIICSNLIINDLTGIEAFTSLDKLDCQNNNLTALNINSNFALTELYCQNNQLTSLSATNNTNLSYLYCSNNNLTSLDVSQNVLLTRLFCGNNTLSNLNVTQNTALINFDCYLNSLSSLDVSQNVSLESFSCYGNSINSLDVSQNTNLDYLHCYDNSINSLDVSNNINLTRLYCYENPLTSLDVSNNINLERLFCQENSLTSLDVSNNTLLEILRCTDNSLTVLDVSNNSNLITLVCSNNNLTELNISNGNNTNIGSGGVTGIVSVNNPNLTCIQVDDVAYSTTNWVGTYFQFDPASSFSTNCIILVSSITVQGAGSATTITTSGGTLQINATVLPANADDGTYTWSVTNGTGSATIDGNGLLTAITDGTVTVTATANDASGETDFMIVTISNQNPIVLVSSITVQGQGGVSTITTSGGTLQMEATVLPANADDGTYTWSVMNGSGSASINASGMLTAITDGTVTVIAEANDASNVAGTKTITISNQTTGINEINSQNISIYPNPVKNKLFVVLDKQEITQMVIIDYSGRVVKSITNNNTKSIDVTDLTQGVYIIKVSTQKGVSTQRFIKK